MPKNIEDRYHVSIIAQATYLPAESRPDENRYAFAYTITITNSGEVPARLLKRHWTITDSNQIVREVHGDGVVGQKPHLHPGVSFEYTSGAVIETPVGIMEGIYELVADDGTSFEAEIPRFTLSVPRIVH